MLVIANGAPKSGSTWLFNIVQNIHQFSDVADEYLLDRSNPNSEIIYEKLEDFLANVDHTNNDYVLKNHFGQASQRDAILGSSDALVINIKRDLKDAIVSGYYYNMKMSGKKRTFDNYYWAEGRFLADHIRRYHRVWEEKPSSRVLLVSYERMKQNTVTEVIGIARFLGFKLSEAEAEAVIQATSMEKLREKYNDQGEIKFFRKGEIGDWEDHFSELQLLDIELIEQCGIDNCSVGRRVFAKGMYLAQFLRGWVGGA